MDAPSGLAPEQAAVWAEGYNGALRHLGPVYVVCWTGGLEEPLFFSTRKKSEAMEKFEAWEAECKEPGDRVDVLRVGLDGDTDVIACGPLTGDEEG